MGSVSTHRPKGITNTEFFQSLYGSNYTVLATSQARGGAVYMAVRHETTSEHGAYKAGDVFAVVVLTHYSPNRWDNFWYKDMDESMGPNEDSCPRKILDLLTPLDDLYGPPFIGPRRQYGSVPGEHARNWRARCEANLARKAARPKVKAGDTIILAQPIMFTNGQSYQRLKYVKGSTFETADTNGMGYPLRVTLRKWRDREFTVEPAAAALETAYAV